MHQSNRQPPQGFKVLMPLVLVLGAYQARAELLYQAPVGWGEDPISIAVVSEPGEWREAPAEPFVPSDFGALLSDPQITALALEQIDVVLDQYNILPKPAFSVAVTPLADPYGTHYVGTGGGTPPRLLKLEIEAGSAPLLEKEARKRIARALGAKGFLFHHLPVLTPLTHRKTVLPLALTQPDARRRPLVAIATTVSRPEFQGSLFARDKALERLTSLRLASIQMLNSFLARLTPAKLPTWPPESELGLVAALVTSSLGFFVGAVWLIHSIRQSLVRSRPKSSPRKPELSLEESLPPLQLNTDGHLPLLMSFYEIPRLRRPTTASDLAGKTILSERGAPSDKSSPSGADLALIGGFRLADQKSYGKPRNQPREHPVSTLKAENLPYPLMG